MHLVVYKKGRKNTLRVALFANILFIDEPSNRAVNGERLEAAIRFYEAGGWETKFVRGEDETVQTPAPTGRRKIRIE